MFTKQVNKEGIFQNLCRRELICDGSYGQVLDGHVHRFYQSCDRCESHTLFLVRDSRVRARLTTLWRNCLEASPLLKEWSSEF